MNLVVVARRPEIGERCAATIQLLTGRHPSRTIDRPVGRSGRPVVARRADRGALRPARAPDAPETCAETIYLTAGGETGRHLTAIVDAAAHPRPAGHRLVAGRAAAREPSRRATCCDGADRLVVDGSTWSGDGLDRLRELAELSTSSTGSRSATSRSSASRAGARRSRRSSTIPEFLPFLASLRRIAVTYATHDEIGAPGSTNLVKPLYHVGLARLAARA